MNAQNLLKKEEDSDSIETQEEEMHTMLGKKTKLPSILVTPKSRMKTIYASWVK